MEFESVVTRYQLQLQCKKDKRLPNNSDVVPWNWVCSNFINLLEKYASGATEAILISELQALWDETPEDWNEPSGNMVTGLQAIVSGQGHGGVLEARVSNTRCIGGSHVWAVTLEDSSGSSMDHYLHPQLSELVVGPCPLLVPGRGVRVVGARASTMGSPPRPVLLPTQYLSVMLGTVPNVFDGHLTDPLETLPLAELSQYRGTSGTCIVAAKVMDIRGNNVYLCDSSVRSPNFVVLELPPAHAQVVKLLRKGEILRISPKVPEAFGVISPATIEYIPGSLLCVQANPLGTTTESVLDGPGIRSMHYTKTRLRIGDIHAGMSGINLLARVVSKGHNKPTSKNVNRYPLILCDIPSAGYTPQTLDVTVWDNAWMLRGLRPGMLVYAENLFAAEEKETTPTTSHNRNYYVVASTQQSSRLRPISSLPGLLSSSLLPITPLSSIVPLANTSAPFALRPSNFIVRATILDYNIVGVESPVFTAHIPCMRVTHSVDERTQMWRCAFCNVSSHASAKGEWEKVFVMQWKISDGSAECLVSASPRVHELILQIRASSFAELDVVEQRARITATFSSSYLFSLTIGIEGQKRAIRIDQLVTPNPIVETHKLVNDLSTLL